MAKRRNPPSEFLAETAPKPVSARQGKKARAPVPDHAVTPSDPDDVPAMTVVAASLVRQKDFAAAISARCDGVKKADLRRVVDATLAELGAALARGQGISLPGFGKARVVKTVERKGGQVLTLKFQPGSAKKAAPTPLDPDAD